MTSYYLLTGGAVVRLETNADGSMHHQVLNQNPANTDYQAYLKWLAEGNEPLPADPQPE